MADNVSEQRVLEVLADFDAYGGTSIGLLAWELFATEDEVREAWERVVAEGWLRPCGYDATHRERLWRLTPKGWAAHRRAGGSKVT